MILKHFYTLAQLKTTAESRGLKNQDYNFRLILFGTYSVATLLLLQLVVSAFIVGNSYAAMRVWLAIFIIIYVYALQIIYKHCRHIAQWMIIALYLFIGLCVLFFWGVNSPIGILTLGFVIFLSNILLGSRYILRTTLLAIVGLVVVQASVSLNLYEPDISSFRQKSTFADILSYAAVFTIFAVTSWISSRQNESSLIRAFAAEKALRREKRLLAKRLKSQERNLRQIQLDEMRQLYKFAELGQLTSSLLHELANHISILNLDVKAFSNQNDTRAIKNINQSLVNIDEMIKGVRVRIAYSNQSKKFELSKCIETAVSDVVISKDLRALKIAVNIEDKLDPRHRFIFGDPMRLSQVTTILVNNAVQAIIEEGVANDSEVRICLQSSTKSLEIHVIDNGIGISRTKHPLLFSPHRSTKKGGMGIGLYIASEFIQTHFNGKIRVDTGHEKTCFKVEIPLAGNLA